MKRPLRMRDLDERLAAARAGVEANERLTARVGRNEATLPEYQLLFRDRIADRLLKIVSTLTVVRAARRAGVAPSLVTPLPDWRLAGRVLSYRPEEALPDVLQEGMKVLHERATRRGDDPVARAEAAITYLVVGSGSGAGRRAQIWTAGLPDYEAARAMSDVTPWHVYHLLHTWQPLDEATRQNFLEQEGRPVPDDQVLNVPLEVVAVLLDNGLWAGRKRPQPAKSGHTPPDV